MVLDFSFNSLEIYTYWGLKFEPIVIISLSEMINGSDGAFGDHITLEIKT